MVLEGIINPFKAEKEPWELIPIGFVYCCVAIGLSLWIFREQASMVMVFLIVLACVPLIYSTIKMEEEKDIDEEDEAILIKEHGKALMFFVCLFIGITLAVALFYIILPDQTAASVFSVQSKTITAVNAKVTGNFDSSVTIFSKIFFNNMRVMIFCLIFALVYGAGAIFILTWNATVIGVAIGNFVKIHLANNYSYFHAASLGLLRYFVHGIPEILGYFVAGLAGGIISIAIIKHDFRTKKFEHIMLDSVDMILLAVGILFLAALIEVYVTPLMF